MEELKKVFIRLMLFVAFFMTILHFSNQLIAQYYVGLGKEQLKKDAYVLGSILEEENCLSMDVLGDTSRLEDFVNGTLRTSETSIFKYNIDITSSNKVVNNPLLESDAFVGIHSPKCAISIEPQYTSYTTCPQKGHVVTATLSMVVYPPTLFENLIDHSDEFAVKYRRMKYEISQDVKVLGFKYYKGKGD